MKILHYIPSIDESSGGVGAYMQLLARDLGKLCELHVVTHRSEKMLTLENCQVHFIPLNNNPFSNKSKREFLQLLETIQPDVFHTNCCWMPQSARTAMWAKHEGYKVIYTPHGMLEPWIMQRHYWTKKVPAMLLFQKCGIQIADMVHATAESEKINLLSLGWNKNITVIPNCVRIDEIAMKPSWERKKNILFLSRVHVKKGINFLIEAVAMLNEDSKLYETRSELRYETEQSSYETLRYENIACGEEFKGSRSSKGINDNVNVNVNVNENENEKNNVNVNVNEKDNANVDVNVNQESVSENQPSDISHQTSENTQLSTFNFQLSTGPLGDYTITIAGPGEEAYVNELKQMAGRLGVADMFRFIGPVFGDKKWELYQNADLFVLPTHSENFGIVVAEALASGTPVITTTGTPWEELNSHRCGWCVPIGSEPLVDALKQFLACSEEELCAMGQRGRKLIMDNYSSESVAHRFVEMYETLRER